jgi:hypothetical protein|tara:strand:+ start:197 stop:316 length:120 start_codon:yes stop_codon:yes gene_type:complete
MHDRDKIGERLAASRGRADAHVAAQARELPVENKESGEN